MPTYTYRCDHCHKRIDAFLSMSQVDDTHIICALCFREMDRIIDGQRAVYFHGRGWSQVDKNYKDGE